MLLTQERVSASPWTVPVVSLVLVAMLVAFYAVVSRAAKAGELRRKATASQATAVVHCRTLPSWDASDRCLKQLHSRQAEEEALLVASK